MTYTSSSEVIVNANLTGNQLYSAVAGLSSTAYAVAWQDDDTGKAYVRIFGADGNALTSAVAVDGAGSGAQVGVSIAAYNDGSFVVSWAADDGVFVQRYDFDGTILTADGSKIGTDVAGTSTFGLTQIEAKDDGGFVVAWQSGTGSGKRGWVEFFDENDASTSGGSFQPWPQSSLLITDVTQMTDGDVVVGFRWVPNGDNVYAYSYNATGTSAPVKTNSSYSGTQNGLQIVELPDGKFMEIWYTVNGPISGRVVLADGQVDSNASFFEISDGNVFASAEVAAAVVGDGRILVVWDDGDAGNQSIHGQLIDSSGQKIDDSFLISDAPTGLQVHPEISTLSDGKVVVSWQSNESGDYDVVTKVLDFSGVGSVSDANSQLDQVDVGAPQGTIVGVSAYAEDPTPADTVTYSLSNDAGGLFAIDPSTGVVTVAAAEGAGEAGTHVITVVAASTDGSESQADFTITVGTALPGDQVYSSVASLSSGSYVVAWQDDSTGKAYVRVYDVDGNALTSALAVDAVGSDVQVGVSVAAYDDGSFVVSWAADDGVFVQRYDFDGTILTADGSKIATDVAGTTTFGLTQIEAKDDGGFVIAWQAGTGAGKRGWIEFFDENDSSTSGGSFQPWPESSLLITDVTQVTDGDVVVGFRWVPNGDNVYAYSYNSTGTSTPVKTNSSYSGTQNGLQIVELPDGKFMEVWYTVNGPINGRVVLANGQVDSSAPFFQISGGNIFASAEVAAVAVGNDRVFVVWDDGDAGNQSIYGQLIDTSGQKIGGIIAISDAPSGLQVHPEIDVLSDGKVVVSWQSNEASDYDIVTKVLNLNLVNGGINSSPAITSDGAGAMAALSVDENVTAVTTVQAMDADGDTVSYSIVGGADEALFQIDDTTGELSFITTPDFEASTDNSYEVIVRASDGQLYDDQVITVTVSDVDEFDVGAVTDVDAAANGVAEDALVGSSVGITASASDADGSLNGITYSLSDDAGGRFAVDPSSGVVTVAAALDAETAESHFITVVATSEDGSSSSASFAIEVSDVDEFDVGTVVDIDATANTVAENAATDTAVGLTVLASDDDVTASVSYSLSDDAGGRFKIDPTSGVVSVADGSLLDYEAATSHAVTVVATSTDGSTSTENFTIELEDDPSDNIPPLTVSIDDAGNVNESNDLVYTVSLNHTHDTDVIVTYSVPVDSTDNTDYTGGTGQTVTILAGSLSADITVPVSDDSRDENNQSVTVTLESVSAGTIVDGSGSGTIVDNDAAPTISIGNDSASEGNPLGFNVTLSHLSEKGVSVTASTNNGSATAPGDYTSKTESHTFGDSETSWTFNVATTEDSAFETTETITVTLSGVSNATIADGSGTGTINDDDPLPVPTVTGFSLSNTVEGGSLIATVTLSHAYNQSLSYTVSLPNDTVDNVDYTGGTKTITIPANSTSGSVSFSTVNDTIDEFSQTVTATLVGEGLTDSGTITDNDAAPSINITDDRDDEGTTLGFVVSLSHQSEKGVSVTATTSNGTAVAPGDYASKTGSHTFGDTTTSWTFNVNTNIDTVVESLEDFSVNLSGVSFATVSDGVGTGQINDITPTPDPNIAPSIVSRSFVFADHIQDHKKQFGYLTVNDTNGDNISLSYLGINADAGSGVAPFVGYGSQIRVDADTVRFAVQAASSVNTIGTGTIGWRASDGDLSDTKWLSVQWDYALETFNSALPIVLDLEGDGIELISIADSHAWYDIDGDGNTEKIGWVSADDGILAYDRDGNGLIEGKDEISFLDDLPGATTDLEGLAAFDTNGNGQFDAGDAAFGDFVLWFDADGNGTSTSDELVSLVDVGLQAIDLTPTPTGESAVNDGNNNVLGTADAIWLDGSTSTVGDVALAYQNIANVILIDLDGDGISTSFAATSGVSFDLDGNGTVNQTDWVVAGDGILVIDRNGNGLVDGVSELTLTGNGTGHDNQLQALQTFDTNGDGLLNGSDADYADLFVWQDVNQDGVSQTDELITLAEAGILELNVGGIQDEDTFTTLLTGDENNPVIALVQVGLVYQDDA